MIFKKFTHLFILINTNFSAMIYENIWLLNFLKLISFVCVIFNILPRSNSWIIFWLFYWKYLSQLLLHSEICHATGFENRILTVASAEKPLSLKFWLSFSTNPFFKFPRIHPLILFVTLMTCHKNSQFGAISGHDLVILSTWVSCFLIYSICHKRIGM